jgi:acetolactate synthase I/III small subunit
VRHTISILVENKAGVVSRVSGLFSGRGYNIESFTGGVTIDPQISVLTIVTDGEDSVIEQINKQLNKLIDVIKVIDLTEVDHVEREMILLKVAPRKENKLEVLRTAEIFRGRVLDSSPETYTIEVTGDEKKIEAFIEMMRPMGIKEFVRTGKVAIAREIFKKAK